MADLRARVDRLPAVQRDAIVLRYAGGLTAREMAGTLGKSEAATQKLLSRALAALRESYRDDG
jgi:DNA-directed RNA polymerase specialized sigma24 family protein